MNYYQNRESDYYLSMALTTQRSLIEVSLSASRFLKNFHIRNKFLHEIKNYAEHHINNLKNTSSLDIKKQSMQELKTERDYLLRQENSLKHATYQQHATIEIRKKLDFFDYVLKGVGIIVGGAQITTGVSIIGAGYTSVYGATIGYIAGAGLIVHGVSNIQENFGAIVENDANFKGYLRLGYENAAEYYGYSKKTGSLVYAGVDLALSGYGLLRSTLKPEARRLFHYMNNEYVYNYELMSGYALGFEVLADGITIKSANDIYNDPDYNKKK
ncbi:DUF4225 domain-containing protein [Xenorhabdus sp. PB62.4]|uniref:DUF4225 domain-containing protein n=1 Tax=Xenorhabdus sp. PB62.4 TaxID=1851573 RepID=UPI0016575D42|nr:DUF4225 domain-containing protein [Xenorhabdus sp. PB62.4]MBC8953311.1 hypothetical protein [Xenorhabdus sp. PB62.4]